MPAKKKPAKKKKATRKKVMPKSLRFEPPDLSRDSWPWPLRPYQQQAYDAFTAGKRRQGLFWHRRAGKDVFCLSMARNESRKRVGSYVHFFPAHSQARRAIWSGVDPKKGARFIDIAFADQEVMRNNTDMFLEFWNGSTWQLLGSDNYNRIVGSNIVGAFFSEFALCDPRAFDYIRPMIRENDGFIVIITTFRGRNHAWQMCQNLKNNEDWHIDIRTVEQTVDIEGKRILTDADMAAERAEGMSEAMISQEYYCDPQATSDGAIYGNQVDHLRNDPARHLADWNPRYPVHCVWNFDLPVFASYLMIQPGERPTIIDCGIEEFTTLPDALAKANTKRWPIQQHFIMAEQRDIAATMTDHLARPEVLPMRNELAVTSHTSYFLERVRLDGSTTELLLDALSGYVRRERFNSQAADLQFSRDPVMSWHWRLAYPLECYAGQEYTSGDTWGPRPSYKNQDRASRILLP